MNSEQCYGALNATDVGTTVTRLSLQLATYTEIVKNVHDKNDLTERTLNEIKHFNTMSRTNINHHSCIVPVGYGVLILT